MEITTGMSAPPIGTMMSTPNSERGEDQEPERQMAFSAHEPEDQNDDGDGEGNVDRVTRGKDDRRAAHAAGELQKRDHRAGEGDCADRDAERHLDQVRLVDGADGPMSNAAGA